MSFLPIAPIVLLLFNGEGLRRFHSLRLPVPTMKLLWSQLRRNSPPDAVIQLEEALAINCNNTAGLGRVIVPLSEERLRLSGEIKQPGGRIIQYC